MSAQESRWARGAAWGLETVWRRALPPLEPERDPEHDRRAAWAHTLDTHASGPQARSGRDGPFGLALLGLLGSIVAAIGDHLSLKPGLYVVPAGAAAAPRAKRSSS